MSLNNCLVVAAYCFCAVWVGMGIEVEWHAQNDMTARALRGDPGVAFSCKEKGAASPKIYPAHLLDEPTRKKFGQESGCKAAKWKDATP